MGTPLTVNRFHNTCLSMERYLIMMRSDDNDKQGKGLLPCSLQHAANVSCQIIKIKNPETTPKTLAPLQWIVNFIFRLHAMLLINVT